MGTYYYGVCHTCSQRVGLGKKIYRFDPRLGPLEHEEIERLTRALAGDINARLIEEVEYGELSYELVRLAAFVFIHGHHDIAITPDTDDATLHLEDVMDSPWDQPLAHRREGAPDPCRLVIPGVRDKNAAEEALDDIATLCGCSHWEYPGQVFRDVKLLKEKLDECNPCQSCGADPSVSPPSGEELPIIAGALDAQAQAERKAMAATRDLEVALSDARQQDAVHLARRRDLQLLLEDLSWRNIKLSVVSAVALVTVVVLGLLALR